MHWLRQSPLIVAVLVAATFLAHRASGQPSYGAVEFQIGAQFTPRPLYDDQYGVERRSPGASAGLLVYSYLHNPVGFRVRGDFAIYGRELRDGSFARSLDILEFSAGADVVPRFARVVVRDVEARFYAGLALRHLLDSDITCVEICPRYRPGPPDGYLNSVGRAGWFLRRASRTSTFRLDLGYQIGKIMGAIQHDLQIRIGVGI